jgi:hypothetical protein
MSNIVVDESKEIDSKIHNFIQNLVKEYSSYNDEQVEYK